MKVDKDKLLVAITKQILKYTTAIKTKYFGSLSMMIYCPICEFFDPFRTKRNRLYFHKICDYCIHSYPETAIYKYPCTAQNTYPTKQTDCVKEEYIKAIELRIDFYRFLLEELKTWDGPELEMDDIRQVVSSIDENIHKLKKNKQNEIN